MTTHPDLQKLDRLIDAQETLSGVGVLPDSQIQETLAQLRTRRAELIAASGERSVAAGSIASSAIHTGDVHNHFAPSGTASESDLRDAYLRWVRQQCRPLPLGGIDPAAAGPDAEPLRLDAIYTALLTLTPRNREPHSRSGQADGLRGGRGTDDDSAQELSGDPGSRLSALELADLEPRLVLQGDPGSGKSTFVNFLALCLAGESLGDADANLARLTRPLPDSEGEDREEPQPWSHGAPIPVRVVLRDFAATGLPPDPAEPATADHLWAHIAAGLVGAGLGDYAPMLRSHLLKKGGLVLLDGLDEVSDASRRRHQVKQSVEAFAALFGGRCRFLVTSRTYAYQTQGWALDGFAPAVLAPWCDGQIRRFIDLWYDQAAALGKLTDASGAAGRAQRLKEEILGKGPKGRLLGLARRPLLLTLIASLHAWRGGNLPERREQLYADAVELLLNLWEGRRYGDAARGRQVVQPSIAEWLDLDDNGRDRVRAVLEDLAFESHARQPELAGTADIPGSELSHRLMRLAVDSGSPAGRRGNPAELECYLRDRAGLLIPRGVDVYSFPHRSFQEYLAACRLTRDTWPDELARLARSDPDRWREVTLLAVAKAARGSAANPWQLAEALCWRDPDDPRRAEEDPHGAFIAGLMLAESANLGQVSEANAAKLGRVRNWLVQLMRESAWPAAERALAGDTLARLGDPRFDPGALVSAAGRARGVPAGAGGVLPHGQGPRAARAGSTDLLDGSLAGDGGPIPRLPVRNRPCARGLCAHWRIRAPGQSPG